MKNNIRNTPGGENTSDGEMMDNNLLNGGDNLNLIQFEDDILTGRIKIGAWTAQSDGFFDGIKGNACVCTDWDNGRGEEF